MLDDEICKLRDKLNKSIEDGEDYSVIYQLSIELDELIAEYYNKNNKKKLLWAVTQKKQLLMKRKNQVKKAIQSDLKSS